MKAQILRKVFLLAGISFMGMQLFANEVFVMKGKVLNSERQTVCDATVNLLDPNTMEIISKGVCNKNGEFVFESINNGEYILSVTKPGFKKMNSRYLVINDNGEIINDSEIIIKNTSRKSDTK